MNIIKTVGVAAEGQGQGRSIIFRFDILTHEDQDVGLRICFLDKIRGHSITTWTR